jgi:RNA polymerase sigma-70 factor (ECF subfamily)
LNQQSDTGQLIARAREGDEASFRSLYRSFAPKARGTLRHMVGPHDLDDLVQDVFERVWKNLPKIRDTAAFSTWFYRITWNVAMDARHAAALARVRTSPEDGNDLTSPERSGAENAIAAKLVIEMALNELDFEHRSVLVLAEYEQLAMSEIAAAMGLPEGTVKSRLFNARKQMRAFLETKGVKP